MAKGIVVVLSFLLFFIPDSLQQAATCDENSDCNVAGNEECGNTKRCLCISGYESDGDLCVDIDECSCSTPEDQCRLVCMGAVCTMLKCQGENEECVNQAGSFTCNCENGFERTDNNFCIDINECALGTCSGNLQTCTNTPGSFICECDPGHTLTDGICVESCEERCNEENEICVVNPLRCDCADGYIPSDNTCIDRNECLVTTTCPDDNMECINTVGSFSCQCQTGYSILGGQCEDINECEDTDNYCQNADRCRNTIGSYICICAATKLLNDDDTCLTFTSYRVKILATELNNTVPQYESSQDLIYEYHFCKVIIDNIQASGFSDGVYNCNYLQFAGNPFIGYLLLRVTNTALSAPIIDLVLEENVIETTTGKMLIRSNDFLVGITLSGTEDSIDVVDIATYSNNPCQIVPPPCENDAVCILPQSVIYDVTCICDVSFSGERCQITNTVIAVQPTTTTGVSTISTELMALIVIIVVILFLFMFCCCCGFCLFYMRNNRVQPPIQQHNIQPRALSDR